MTYLRASDGTLHYDHHDILEAVREHAERTLGRPVRVTWSWNMDDELHYHATPLVTE